MKKFLLALIAFIIVAGGAYYVATNDVIPDGPTNENTTLDKKPADPRITNTWKKMLGTWSSEDDRNFQRTYTDSSIMIDEYSEPMNDGLSESEWSLFVSANAPQNLSFDLDENAVYVMQLEDNGDVMYFRVVNVTDTELELLNMERGNTLRFGRMNGNEMQDGIEESELLSIAFRCDNQSSFVATFGMELVTIESEGEANEIPMVTATPGNMTFENDMWSFNFRGQGQDYTAVVYDKTLKTTTMCNEQ